MASTKSTGNPAVQSRRRFMAACGVIAGAAALPAAGQAPRGWRELAESMLPELRAAYLADVERRAEALRSRFESGELRGWSVDPNTGDRPDDDPFFAFRDELEAEISDFHPACLILACSPAGKCGLDGSYDVHNVPEAAAECLLIDIFRAARAHGWWRPGPYEYIGQDEWLRVSGREP